jgi:amino acid adenylation domain-containing protein
MTDTSGFRLSPEQSRIWSRQRDAPTSWAQCVISLPAGWDPDRLTAAIGRLTARYEILRTGFVHFPLLADAVQTVEDGVAPDLVVADLRSLPSADRDAAVEDLLRRHREPADLSKPVLLRLTLATIDDDGAVLICSAPTMVADVRALRALAAEIEREYRQPGQPAGEVLQYADYAQWRIDEASPAPPPATAFWAEQWPPDARASSQPPAEFPAAAGASGFGSALVPVSADLRSGLQAFAAAHDLSLSVVLMTAWWLVLDALGLADGAIWLVADGRDSAGLGEAIGCFEQPVPLALPPRGRTVTAGLFSDLARAVADIETETLRWKDSAPAAELSAAASAGFRFVGLPIKLPGAALLPVLRLVCDGGRAVDLTAWLEADGLRLEICFNSAQRDRIAASTLGERLTALLGDLCAHGDLALAELDVRSAQERAVAERRNDTRADLASTTAAELFLAQAAAGPDRAAVIFGRRLLSYAALYDRAMRVCAALRMRGCGPGDRVGICLPRSPNIVAAVLGVWFTGAAFVPLSPADPAARIARLLELSGCRLVIVDETTDDLAGAGRSGASPGPVRLRIGRAAADPKMAGEQSPALAPVTAVAYVAYTSGSTGDPQGILATGTGLANYLAYLTHEYALGPADVALQLAPFTFDAWLRDCIGPLTVGASVVMLDELTSRIAAETVEHIQRHGVTRLLHIVPTMLRDLVQAARERPPSGLALRTVLCSGEVLRQSDCAEARASLGPAITVVNQYGPTECTLTSTFYRSRPEASTAATPVPIGQPIRNAVLHVLDERIRPTPAGVVGEIYLGGVGLSYGYLGQPGRTAQRFLPDPFTVGGRLYRTGDLAVCGADGQIELRGRRDSQVKIRGIRIEVAEIETVLVSHQAVREAAVVACRGLPAESDPSALVAAVVLADSSVSIADLRQFLSERLPTPMVPSKVAVMDALPRNRNGKVDRKALVADAERLIAEPDVDERSASPVSLLEQIVADSLADVLGRDTVSVLGDFFTLGGHSLAASRVAYRISKRLGWTVPMRAVFECPTARGLAGYIRRVTDGPDAARIEILAETAPGGEHSAEPGDEAGQSAQIPRVEGSGPHPVSFAQRRLWIVDRLRPGPASNNVQATVLIEGPLAPEPFRSALSYVSDRHPTLNTCFKAGPDGEPLQQLMAPLPVELAEVDLTTDESGQSMDVLLASYSRGQADRPFDLAQPPLWRAALACTGAYTHVLLLTAHHIVLDEWSAGVVLRDLVEAYTAFLGGREPDLPPPAVSYADFAAWQRSRLTEQRLAEMLGHWRERLGGAAFEIDLPFDFPRPANPSYRGERIVTPISGDLVDQLNAVGQSAGATLYMVLLAAFATLVSHYGACDDIAVGSPVANRNHPDLEEVVGCFVNVLVMRIQVGGDPAFADLLTRVRETALDAYAHEETPFEKVVEALRPSRMAGRVPLVQLWFVLHNAAPPVLSAPGMTLTMMETDRGSSQFDLNMALSETADGLSAALEYSADVFRRVTAERILRRYCELLEWIAAQPGERLSELGRKIEEHDEKERKVAANDRTQARMQSFAAVRAAGVKPVRVSSESLVRIGRLTAEEQMPALIEPEEADVDLAAWVEGNREALKARLHEVGACLFRGFSVNSVEDFERIVRSYSPDLLDYYERQTPRQVIGGKVYSSTDYPPERTIPLHPESAYSHYWPRILWFWCQVAAERGGATPVADNRRILALLGPEVREKFERLGVRYVRTYHEGFDIPWQVAFQTTEREVVDEYCRRAGMTWEWRADGLLRTEHVLDGIVRHPVTGEAVWFNQVCAWHLAGLEPEARSGMQSTFGDDNLPRNVYYGDGSKIGSDEIAAILAAHDAAIVSSPWQNGDLLLIDNMLSSHGREPFDGPRRVLVAMSDPFDREKLRAATTSAT